VREADMAPALQALHASFALHLAGPDER
jgi:hypothetical protein